MRSRLPTLVQHSPLPDLVRGGAETYLKANGGTPQQIV